MSTAKARRGFRRLGPTPLDRAFPSNPEFLQLAQQLSATAEERMLALVWSGYDRLRREFGPVMATPDDRQIERSIASALESFMQMEHDNRAGYHIKHEAPEMATALSNEAHPPAYDIAFVMNANLRIMWPLEAKVLRHDGQVGAYVDDLRSNLLTGRYAPFSRSGGMLGFLLIGQPEKAVANIASRLATPLEPCPPFHPDHAHYRSCHQRVPMYDFALGGAFTCHHLILQMVCASGSGVE